MTLAVEPAESAHLQELNKSSRSTGSNADKANMPSDCLCTQSAVADAAAGTASAERLKNVCSLCNVQYINFTYWGVTFLQLATVV